MPGSTASGEQSKAKVTVTESSATNGIFVRPVAVAGIFRPAEEYANKPPALPEKRRFSTLSGDLRPCSTGSEVSNDDFARRRQSWDVKAKEAPFGQSLLRKTPRNTNTSPHTSKQELSTNGSSHENMSCNDESSEVLEAKSFEKLNFKSESSISSSASTSNSLTSVKEVTVTNVFSKKGKIQIKSNSAKDEQKVLKYPTENNRNNISNENSINVGSLTVSNSSVVNEQNKISVSEKSVIKNVNLDTVDKSSNSIDNIQQPKKVYGLIKRDSKSDATLLKAEKSVNISELKPSKLEKSSVKKETQLELCSKSEDLHEKTSNNTDSSKSKSKVYGLSKTNIKKDIVKDINENEIQKKTFELNFDKKPTASAVINKVLSSNVVGKSSESAVVNKQSEINIVAKATDKSLENKSNHFPDSTPSNASEVKATNKLSENNASSKIVEDKTINKSSENRLVNKRSESKVTNKSVERNRVNDEAEIKDVSKVIEGNSLTPKESLSCKSADSKVVEKVHEFQKGQSPPKDFRTVRRTSDVIAAKIQNIFSNISTPEKPLPLLSRKSKIQDKSNSESSSITIVEKESVCTTKLEQNAKQNDVRRISVKENQVKLSSGAKTVDSDIKSASEVEAKVAGQKVKIIKGSEKDSSKELKNKEQTLCAADQSTLKKENKLALESSNALQSRKASREIVTTPSVKIEVPLEKADSKTKHSINAAPSKIQDKKNLNIEGKMPIKKQDQNSLDCATSLKATNQSDRKSSDLTYPLKTGTENSNKSSILKTETTSTCAGSGEKIPKSVSLTNSLNSAVDIKNNYNVSKKIESNVSVKECCATKSAVQKTESASCVNEKSQYLSGGQKSVETILNNKIETVHSNQASKIEVAKITPTTVPGSVPTVNVLFRTKSPQSTATKEENRKKVVVETYSSSSIPSAVINASKISDKISSAPESVQEALKAVESVQKSLNSPRLSSRHSIVNLKKEELATVTLAATDSSIAETSMPPSTAKIIDKCSSIEVNDDKNETPSTAKGEVSAAVISEALKAKSSETAASLKVDSSKSDGPNRKSEINNKVDIKAKLSSASVDSSSNSIESVKKESDMDKLSVFEAKVKVVDLNDWSKKFQLPEPETPRVPVRRRTVRESMPPVLPVRSRFGSLKRIDDSPRYIPRSPSQSSLPPQRYSYTEMLSKVCSMGVLPFTEPMLSKSCSSSMSSQVSELWSELSEEQSNATHTSEMLESETTERMRLEKEVQELQNRCSQVQLKSDKMEMEMMEARVYRTPELNGDLSEDEDVEANSSLYKQKYERAVRDMEIMKRRMQQQHEEEIEQKAMLKKASDKRLAEALEDVEEERQVANQWKRKAQKLGSELQDLRIMLEEQMARNGELEKKQRRFDSELSAAQEEIKKERLLREKFSREKDQAMHEKYSLEQDLQSAKLDSDTLHEKITQLSRELDELTLSSKGEEEVTQLKRAKQELERKCRDQEEELEELAAQVGMLEQAKLRLEMSLEKVRQEHRREASVREEEIEEIRASFSKKIKNLEAQLETEQDERHQLLKQKHELERRLYEIVDQPPVQDPEIERRLRRDLKRTKALLRDAQSMLEHTREGQSGKTLIRQLKNQLEDSEFAKAAAVKARQAVEAELHDCQTQLEETTRAKNEAESRCLQLSREKSAIQTQLEEAEEEMAEVMKKYKAVVAQMSIDQKALSEQNQQIADLETEKQMLKDQLSEVSHKFEHLAGQSEDTHKVHRLDGKVRDLESKLELEQTTRSRLEHQIARLKEQNERAREECDSLRNKELQAQEGVRRLQRQLRDLREDYSALQQKEAEAYRKQHELEMALENTETDLQVTKNDLRLACQRIQDLQNALEDDLDSGTDVPDDSGSDSDDSFELSVLRNQSVTPTQRCDSAGSNYSLASEGFRSRTSSFTQELSAFSSRNDAESKDFNGFSGMNTASRVLDVEHDETV